MRNYIYAILSASMIFSCGNALAAETQATKSPDQMPYTGDTVKSFSPPVSPTEEQIINSKSPGAQTATQTKTAPIAQEIENPKSTYVAINKTPPLPQERDNNSRKKADPAGFYWKYEKDDAGRIISAEMFKKGLIPALDKGFGKTTYQYNGAGYLKSEKKVLSGSTTTRTYEYKNGKWTGRVHLVSGGSTPMDYWYYL